MRKIFRIFIISSLLILIGCSPSLSENSTFNIDKVTGGNVGQKINLANLNPQSARDGEVNFINDNRLDLNFKDTYGFIMFFPLSKIFSNVTISLILENTNVSGGGGLSIICRASQNNFEDGFEGYSANIYFEGYYLIYKWTKGETITLVNGKIDNDQIFTTGKVNMYSFECNDNNLRLYINKKQITSVADNQFSSGYIGLDINGSENENHSSYSLLEFAYK